MQKVLRRTQLAKGQARRKAEQSEKIKASNLYRYAKRQQKPLNAETRGAVRAARRVQQEDWTLGALAPKRDAGADAEKYGTVSVRRIQPPVEKGDGWWKDYCIAEGDRVVIVEPGHRDRGKIGTVKELKMKAEHCVVQGLNEVDVAVPEYMLVSEKDKSPRRTVEAPLPLSSVNLIYPLQNPITGELRDVIITQMTRGKVRDPKKPPERYIADYESPFSIPYPEEEEVEYKDHDCDTFRIEVEKRTWVPTLIRPPMPPSIIDELRNKYSKFRDRHDEDFILKKKKEDEAAERKKRELKQLMRSPTQELYKREQNRKKRAGSKQKLDEDTLSIIGQHMAKHRGLSLPQAVNVPNGTTTGLTSAAPSRATSSAIRSTLSMPLSSSTTLSARSFHASGRLNLSIVQRIAKRHVSTTTPGTLQPSFTGTNDISASDMAAFTSDRWTVPLSNNVIRMLSAAKSHTTLGFGLRGCNFGSAWDSVTGVVNGEAGTGSESLSHQPESYHAATSRRIRPKPNESTRRSKSSQGTPIRKFESESKLPLRKMISPLSIRLISHSLTKSMELSTETAVFQRIRSLDSKKMAIRKVDAPLDGRLTTAQEAHMLHELHKYEKLAKAKSGEPARRVDSHLGLDPLTPFQRAQALHLRQKQGRAVNTIKSQSKKLKQEAKQGKMSQHEKEKKLRKTRERAIAGKLYGENFPGIADRLDEKITSAISVRALPSPSPLSVFENLPSAP